MEAGTAIGQETLEIKMVESTVLGYASLQLGKLNHHQLHQPANRQILRWDNCYRNRLSTTVG